MLQYGGNFTHYTWCCSRQIYLRNSITQQEFALRNFVDFSFINSQHVTIPPDEVIRYVSIGGELVNHVFIRTLCWPSRLSSVKCSKVKMRSSYSYFCFYTGCGRIRIYRSEFWILLLQKSTQRHAKLCAALNKFINGEILLPPFSERLYFSITFSIQNSKTTTCSWFFEKIYNTV